MRCDAKNEKRSKSYIDTTMRVSQFFGEQNRRLRKSYYSDLTMAIVINVSMNDASARIGKT